MNLRWTQGLGYGLLGLPLAFVALPLYVLLPNHYARELGVPLATLGGLLLLARLFDAVIDPLLGRLGDRLLARSARAALAGGAVAAILLALAFAGLFMPPALGPQALLGWAALMLALAYAGYSALSLLHQAWGAMLGNEAAEGLALRAAELARSRPVAWREGLGLAGVLMASVLPLQFGLPVMVGVFVLALLAGWLGWALGARPARGGPVLASAASWWQPFGQPAFRRLLLVFVLNGSASAIPATLVLFFIQDRLQASADWQAAFLGGYFLAAALSIPLWLRAVQRHGLLRCWLAGMVLSVAAFLGTVWLQAGQWPAFGLICALSGLALGSDLALPGALLAGVIRQAPGAASGLYFGWWNFATKLNLALAAGLALPLLAWLGYTPGARSPEALQALSLAYGLLPCVLKGAAATALVLLLMRPAARLEAQPCR